MVDLILFDDRDYVNMVYQDPFIAGRIRQDGLALEHVDNPYVYYLMALQDGVPCGFFAIANKGIEHEIHVCLQQSAIRNFRTFGRLAIDYCFSQGIQRLTAPISSANRSVINYCLKLGFRLEGVKRCAIMVDGHLFDEVIMGMTREDYGRSR